MPDEPGGYAGVHSPCDLREAVVAGQYSELMLPCAQDGEQFGRGQLPDLLVLSSDIIENQEPILLALASKPKVSFQHPLNTKGPRHKPTHTGVSVSGVPLGFIFQTLDVPEEDARDHPGEHGLPCTTRSYERKPVGRLTTRPHRENESTGLLEHFRGDLVGCLESTKRLVDSFLRYRGWLP